MGREFDGVEGWDGLGNTGPTGGFFLMMGLAFGVEGWRSGRWLSWPALPGCRYPEAARRWESAERELDKMPTYLELIYHRCPWRHSCKANKFLDFVGLISKSME